jgi:hypothetical protein
MHCLKMTHTDSGSLLNYSKLATKVRSGDHEPIWRRLQEQAADDGGLRRADFRGGEQLGEAVAEVVHLPVEAPDAAACLLQHRRRRHLCKDMHHIIRILF